MKIIILAFLIKLTLSNEFHCRILKEGREEKFKEVYNFDFHEETENKDVIKYTNKKHSKYWYGISNYIGHENDKRTISQNANDFDLKMISRAVYLRDNKEWFIIFYHQHKRVLECKDSNNYYYLFWKSFSKEIEIKKEKNIQIKKNKISDWSFGLKMKTKVDPTSDYSKVELIDIYTEVVFDKDEVMYDCSSNFYFTFPNISKVDLHYGNKFNSYFYKERIKIINMQPNKFFVNLFLNFVPNSKVSLFQVYSQNYGFLLINTYYLFLKEKEYYSNKGKKMNENGIDINNLFFSFLVANLNKLELNDPSLLLSKYVKFKIINKILDNLAENVKYFILEDAELYRGKKMTQEEYDTYNVGSIYETIGLLSTTFDIKVAKTYSKSVNTSCSAKENEVKEDIVHNLPKAYQLKKHRRNASMKKPILDNIFDLFSSCKEKSIETLDNEKNMNIFENKARYDETVKLKAIITLHVSDSLVQAKSLIGLSKFSESECVIKPGSKFKLTKKQQTPNGDITMTFVSTNQSSVEKKENYLY